MNPLYDYLMQHPDKAIAVLFAVMGAVSTKWLLPWWRLNRIRAKEKAAINAELPRLILQIREEFSCNHGSSLRDQMDLANAGIRAIGEKVESLDARFHVVCGFLPMATFETDADGRVTSASRVFTQWTHRATNELLGDGWLLIIHPEDRDWVAQDWKSAISGIRRYEGEHRYINSDGVSFPVRCEADPMVLKGNFIGFSGRVMRMDTDIERRVNHLAEIVSKIVPQAPQAPQRDFQ